MGRNYPDWEEQQYLQHFRVSKDTFWYICQRWGKYFKKQTTHLRLPLPPAKRLAIVLHWLAHGTAILSWQQCTQGKATVVAIAHEGIAILWESLVPEVILFPTGLELDQMMVDFESQCVVPYCGGALDGTFMPIKKPSDFGDTYFCYKRFTAIIVLGCMDS